MISGAVGRFRSEKVCDPEQPLKLYPTVIDVTVSSADTVKPIGMPWAVTPLQWPTLKDEAASDGPIGPPQPLARGHASITKQTAALAARRAAGRSGVERRQKRLGIRSSERVCDDIGQTARPLTTGVELRVVDRHL
jgi:hypothetical protein